MLKLRSNLRPGRRLRLPPALPLAARLAPIAPSRRPKDFLASFFPEGRLPQFTRAAELSPRADGKPMLVYCLLYSCLDDYTQRLWQRAGLFNAKPIMLSPFLLTVTIRDQAALDYLIDWHVESVALSLPNPAGAKQ